MVLTWDAEHFFLSKMLGLWKAADLKMALGSTWAFGLLGFRAK